MSEIEKAARRWVAASTKREIVDACNALIEAVQSTPPRREVTLTVEEAEALIAELNAGDRTGAADDLHDRIAKARGASRGNS